MTEPDPPAARAAREVPDIGFLRAILGATVPLVTGSFPLYLTGALGVRLRGELGFGEAGLGLAVGMVPATAALTSLVMGRVVHRIGAGAGLRLGVGTAAVSLLGTALFASGYATLLGFLVVGGLALAMVIPATDFWVARMVAPARQGIAMGFKQSATQMAGLLAGLAVPALAVTLGWRWAFVAGALLALAAVPTIPASAAPRERQGTRGREGDVLWKPLAILALAIGLGQMSVLSLVGFSVTAAVDAGISESVAGIVFAVGNVVGIATRLRLGHLADVHSRNQLYVAGALLAVGGGCYLLLATANPIVLSVVIPLAFATGWGWPGLVLLAVIRANPEAPAVASSVAAAGGYVGAFAGPFAFGALAARSLVAAWSAAAGSALLAAGAMVVAGRVIELRSRAPEPG